LVIILTNSGFSIFAGFVIFSVIGHIAEVDGVPVEDVAASGASLAFVVFARALSLFSSNGAVCCFFSAIFFMTLVMLGLDSAFAWTETINSYAQDFLRSRQNGQPLTKRTESLTLIGICVASFLVGLIYTTRAGFKYLDVVDHFCPTYCLLIVAFLEYILFGWVYGVDKMIENIRTIVPDNKIPGLAVGSKYEWIWHAQMKYVGPLFLGGLTINQAVTEFNGSQTAVDEATGIETYGGYNFYAVLFLGWGGIAIPLLFVAWLTWADDIKNALFGYEKMEDQPRAGEADKMIAQEKI
jgi:NSS family neurotransmitter:Na+ symporter